MKPTPINMAEAIFEPFWDPQISGLKKWQIEPGEAHGLKVFQQWCFAQFDWARKPASGPALRMTRRFDVECAGYDRLMVSVVAPHNAIFRMLAETDRGHVAFETVYTSDKKKEYTADLHGASVIHSVTLEFEPQEDGVAMGWINWLGLQNTELLARFLAEWQRFDKTWEGYLQPEGYQPRFEPTVGLLIDKDELKLLRSAHEAHLREHGKSPFTEALWTAEARVPERMIHDFVNFWEDDRYCREREYDHLLIRGGPAAAVAGLLLRDERWLRLAARYAMALAMCGRWDDGFICYYPDGPFEHRAFVHSLCMYDVALVLDLAGEMFTDLGRDLLLRRLAEEGEGAINFNTWKHEYIFHNNQMPWFTPGRMAAYLVLERAWPRVRPYTDLALKDLVESIDNTILSDGGYVEGPTYFGVPAGYGGVSLYMYARARGLDFDAVVPDSLRRAAALGDVLSSTDENADVMPICDGRPLVDEQALAVMAALAPQSQWPNMLTKALQRTGMPGSAFAWQMARRAPGKGPEPKPFALMPEMGPVASTRAFGGERVKLFIQGNRAGAGHTHEDKGSFILEFAGDTFAMDPGTCSYGNPLADILKHCERHNMLVPAGMPERPHPVHPLPMDIRPEGEGDETRFSAHIDLSAGWQAYYRRWVRRWESPTPDVLTISDEYELVRGDGVEFLWNTRLPVAVEGRQAVITGKRGRAIVEAPAGCTLRVDDLPLLDGSTQHRLAIRREGVGGRLVVEVKLEGAAG